MVFKLLVVRNMTALMAAQNLNILMFLVIFVVFHIFSFLPLNTHAFNSSLEVFYRTDNTILNWCVFASIFK